VTPPHTDNAVTLRPPRAEDGRAVHDLIARCPPLDPNSLYCNLLQCTHFATTCVVAELDSRIVGFVSGYIVPATESAPATSDGKTLFVWQVAIDSSARGQGLGKRMLAHLLGRAACSKVTELHTTITPSNRPSWALFEAFAHDQGASLTRQSFFDRHAHLDGAHESEELVRIGPLNFLAQNLRRTA